jgi:hypothetical protein
MKADSKPPVGPKAKSDGRGEIRLRIEGSKHQKKIKDKTKTFYERKIKSTDGRISVGPPVGRRRDSAKPNQKGVLAAGRFAPASRLILV